MPPQLPSPAAFGSLPPVPSATPRLPARGIIRRFWWVGLIILLLPVLFGGGILYIVWLSIANSNAMKTFSTQITGTEFADVGTVRKVSLAPRLPMSLRTSSVVNGPKSGTATFVTRVEGTTGTRLVAVHLELKPGKNWEVLDYKIEPPDSK